MASLEVDLSGIEEGNTVTVKWRGKPVFIRHRTADEISEAENTDVTGFRDPQTDAERVIDPKVRAWWWGSGCGGSSNSSISVIDPKVQRWCRGAGVVAACLR